MKKILPALFVLVTLSAGIRAQAAEISSIDCLASNGLIMKGAAHRGETLKVDTQWGLVHEEFIATIGANSTDATTYVNLDSVSNEHYVLALDANPARAGELQKSSGTILQPSTVRGFEPAIVAYVRCDLRIR